MQRNFSNTSARFVCLFAGIVGRWHPKIYFIERREGLMRARDIYGLVRRVQLVPLVLSIRPIKSEAAKGL